jgi:6-phosphofructokinase 1
VDYLAAEKIDVLLCVGGDGTQRGAHAIAEEVQRRGLPIAVVGIPKTIDNDILYVKQTFGFTTAIDEARDVLNGAHAEAKGALNGIGLVKVMGRDSGFIATGATLASQEVNFTIIPEVPLKLDGKKGFLNVLRERMLKSGHAVIVVAEGAGQGLIPGEAKSSDASGNKALEDIGLFLKAKIKEYFASQDLPVSVKYIDPSYIIRSVPANSEDSLLCDQYARHAVHAAMAGKTDMLVGYWNGQYIHVPLSMAIKGTQHVHPESDLWNAVISSTGQPPVWE